MKYLILFIGIFVVAVVLNMFVMLYLPIEFV